MESYSGEVSVRLLVGAGRGAGELAHGRTWRQVIGRIAAEEVPIDVRLRALARSVNVRIVQWRPCESDYAHL